LHSLSARATVSAERGSGQVQSRSRRVFMVTDEPEGIATGEATLLKCIEQLEKQLEWVAKGNRGARGSSSRKASSNKEASAHDAAGWVSLFLVMGKWPVVVQRCTHVTFATN